MKNAQHHSLSEKCKSKPQWGTISRQSEWLLSKSLQTINAGKGVEKKEPSCTVGGNVNWYNHYREQYGGLKKIKNRATYMILQSHSWTWIWRKLYLEKIHAPPVSTAVLYTIAKTWTQFHLEAIQMSIDRWMDKENVVW